MKTIKLFLFVNLFLLSINSALAEGIVLNQSKSKNSHKIITKTVDLKTTIKSFRKLLASNLNKRDCEKKMFVKKAKLSTSKNLLIVEIQARITRQYCTRRAKTQLYEKTSTITFKYQITTEGNGLRLTEVGKDYGKPSFLKLLKDILEAKPEDKVAEILKNEIEPKFKKLNQSLEQTNTDVEHMVSINSNTIVFKFISDIETK